MPDPHDVRPGLAGSITHAVTAEDTAIALGSGDVPVLGTPRVVALAEEAACAALLGHLEGELTSVGVHLEIDHLRPTKVGGTVTAAATVDAVEGRKVDFTFSVVEGQGEQRVEVARGVHRRVIAPRATFTG